ncbi:hypothetical protein HRJ34_26030 [Rhizorhabdus wittichii]|uniref:Uncharacterized protein n=1 Tax=Rhizorhabdus wittichii TaxID=160791 RepID=A0A975D3Q8_9SPHN|nr:hypothetical protein [Rhizorhabdus wittichii]QTH21716.1 hypothetical protein HRJ34_26030 [Rhizorhabdus wittichii]
MTELANSESISASQPDPTAIEAYMHPSLDFGAGFRFVEAIAQHYFIKALAGHCSASFDDAERAFLLLNADDRLWVNSPAGWTELARQLCTPETAPLFPVLH